MLRNFKDLQEYAIGASDGSIGHIRDFLFDDKAWVVRYFVVETGSWLSSRKVLISPIAINQPNWKDKLLPVSLTRDQVKHSPDVDSDKPISRQYETEYSGYYGYPYYWGGVGLWGGGMYPYVLYPGYTGLQPGYPRLSPTDSVYSSGALARHRNDDPHLRSCREVIGYHIAAKDGEIGHVSGLLVDEETWSVRYLIIDTSNWWIDNCVLISPEWIDDVSWTDRKVMIDLTRQAIKDAPPYSSNKELNREGEIGLYRHYSRSGYWSEHTIREKPITTA